MYDEAAAAEKMDRRMTPVDEAVQRIREILGARDALIEELSGRLGQYLRSSPPSALDDGQVSPISPDRSEHVIDLHRLADRIESQNRSVRSIIDRFDI